MDLCELRWSENSNEVSWKYAAERITKYYQTPVQSVQTLSGGDGIVIVEPYRERGPRNAVVFNADGTERFRLAPPFPEGSLYGYYYVYYEGRKLKAVIATTSGDFAVTIDPETGLLSDIQETR
jgi:hypothetical protein